MKDIGNSLENEGKGAGKECARETLIGDLFSDLSAAKLAWASRVRTFLTCMLFRVRSSTFHKLCSGIFCKYGDEFRNGALKYIPAAHQDLEKEVRRSTLVERWLRRLRMRLCFCRKRWVLRASLSMMWSFAIAMTTARNSLIIIPIPRRC